MKRIITSSAMLLAALLLAACTTATTRHAVRGEHQQAVASVKSSGGGFLDLGSTDHQRVCDSLIKLREFKTFFECHAALVQRVEASGGYLEYEVVGGLVKVQDTFFNKPWSSFILENMLAEAYLALGQYDDVIEHAGKAVALADNNIFQSRHEEEAGATSKAFLNIMTLGNEDERKREYTLASAIDPLGYLGLAYVARGRLQEAAAVAQRLTTINTGTMSTRGYDVRRRAAIARIYFARQDYEKALTAMTEQGSVSLGGLFVDALNVVNVVNPANYIVSELYFGATSLQDIQYIGEFEQRFMLYRCQLETGRLQEAKQGYDQALAEPRLPNFGQMYYLTLYDRGRIALREGDAASAVDYFRRAIDVIESQRSSITLERFKIGFAGDKQVVYSTMVQTLARLGRAGQALEYAERGKARALVDLLAYRNDFSDQRQPARSRELLRELDELERKSLASAGQQSGGSTTRSARTALNEIKTLSPELASLVSVSTLTAAEIQAGIQPDEALVEYFYEDDEQLFAFVVSRERVDVFSLDGRGLKQAVRQFRRAINTYPGNDWQRGSAELYTRLITPLHASIRNKRHLTIVPHGVLHYLPFNALRATGDARGERFLIEDHTVRLLPSASILRFLDKPSRPNSNMLVFGNPDLNNPAMDLPGAENEARAIARNWSDAKVILRKNASESLFKKSSGGFRYIHLASHGEFNPDVPTDSRMLLSPDTANDGNLTISEIYDLRLNADMVTLSACQTGLGDVKNGDDVVGLNRGFLYAGAKSIVASLWSVPDESTRVLMTTFYDKLKTMDKRSALQQAQLVGIKKYRHPIAWAAFQMTGGA